MRRPLTTLDLFAYLVVAFFTIIGLVALAGGDAEIGANRTIRGASRLGGVDRIAFGWLLLAAAYGLWRWVFRRPETERRWTTELRIIGLFALLGYCAYCIGG